MSRTFPKLLRLTAGLCMLLLAGCGLWPADPENSAAENAGTEDPYAARSRSDEIARQAEEARLVGDLVRYSVRIDVQELTGREKTALEELMRRNSQLVNLENDPPDSDLGLERRYLDDEATARSVLRSQGYYKGTAHCEVDWKAQPVVAVTLQLIPGPRFTVDKSSITYKSPPDLPEKGKKSLDKAPETLAAFGVRDGDPALADVVLAAVGKVPGWLADHGFPFASATAAYRLFQSSLHLNPEVAAVTGPYARFGEVTLAGAENVNVEYLRRLVPWLEGAQWSSRRLDFYRDTLQQTGLFREVRVEPAKDVGKDGLLPVQITAAEADFKRISGSMRYATDLGFGVQGVWEHRNLFSSGEQLRLTMTLAQELQEFSTAFTKPAFGRPGQNFVMQGLVRKEVTEAYDLKAAAVEAGLDRFFNWRWWGGFRVTAQSGKVRESETWDAYSHVGLPVSVRYFGANNPLNSTKGFRAQTTVTPTMGRYRDNAFGILRMQGEISAYHAPFTRPDGQDWDRLVLAARFAAGAMPNTVNDDVHEVPAALRFYTGGGGSVRGYKYQSIGPEDDHGNPLGGLSSVDLNFEARFRVTESVGIVPFLDGGMVYETPYPKLNANLAWAAGLGLRYYTAIGPVRLDVAFPLQNRSKDPFQLYISIGQAF